LQQRLADEKIAAAKDIKEIEAGYKQSFNLFDIKGCPAPGAAAGGTPAVPRPPVSVLRRLSMSLCV